MVDLKKQVAFEKHEAQRCNCDYEDLKRHLDKVEALSGHRYTPTSPRSDSWIAWSAAWDARQAEINELKAKLEAAQVPEGFVLVPKEKLSVFWQDDDEPENIVSDESDFNSLGDCIDLGDVMTIKKHTQANIETETLYGTWFAEVINPSEKANFFVGTHEECLDIVKKNKAMIEAAQGEDHE